MTIDETYQDEVFNYLPARELLEFASVNLAVDIYPKLVALVAMKFPEFFQTDIYLILQNQTAMKYNIESRYLLPDSNNASIIDNVEFLDSIFGPLDSNFAKASNIINLMIRRSNEENILNLNSIMTIFKKLTIVTSLY
jgi:hypothetical protein